MILPDIGGQAGAAAIRRQHRRQVAGANAAGHDHAIRTERKALDRTLAAAARRSDVGRRLMTIPGVGPVTSMAYIATVDDPSRFGTSKALGAHLGLTPRV